MRPLRRRPSDSPRLDALASRRVRNALLGSYSAHMSAEGSPIVASAKFVVYNADSLDEGEAKRRSTQRGKATSPDSMNTARSEGGP